MQDRAVHPAAAVFPMLSDDELRDLAEDIKTNGLLHPITIDEDGAIVDGRNRYAACGMAGVEPRFAPLNGQDPFALILSANERRRHLSAGQRAMAVAMFLEIDDGQRTEATRLGLQSKLSKGDVSKAATIRRYASDLAPGVLAGTEAFRPAYEVALVRKRRQEDETLAAARRASEETIELERIRRAAPDIAALVPGSLTVDEAKVALSQRLQRDRDRTEATTRLAESAFSFLDHGLAATPEERAAQIAATLDATVLPARPDLSWARARRCLKTFEALCEQIRERESTDGHRTAAG